MDLIFIQGLRVDTVIGVFDWERQVKQTVCLDLELAADCRRAAASDELADTLDYKRVAKRVSAYVGEGQFGLVETLAERVAALLLDEFSLPWVRVRVDKQGALRGAAGVGVVLERGERD